MIDLLRTALALIDFQIKAEMQKIGTPAGAEMSQTPLGGRAAIAV